MKHALAAALAITTASADAQFSRVDPGAVIDTITFASCARQDQPTPAFDTIAAEGADVFLFIGDNVYCDLNGVVPEDRAGMRKAWDTLAAKPRWQRFERAQPILATWDDHDFGKNDAGREWRDTEAGSHAEELFLDFFNEPDDSARRQRPGIYDAAVVGPEGKRVQIILLDTRSFRSPLTRNPGGRPTGRGPYIPATDGSGTLLGEDQWAWLEQQLREPAEVRILASSIQVVADEHGWETWGNLPRERDRLYRLVDETDASGLIVVSGDRHLMELSKDTADAAPYPIYDFTSSGLNWEDEPHVVDEPNTHRIGDALRQINYGLITIDWNDDDPDDTTVSLIGRGPDGDTLLRHPITLGELQDRD